MDPNPRRPLAAAALAVAALAAAGPALLTRASAPAAAAPETAAVARGEYLVAISGCGDCHTPMKMGPNGPEPDAQRHLSGHPEQLVMPPPPDLGKGPWVWIGAGTNTAFAGPWGISYATNLTPDENTGLGIWTEEMFVKALRTGRHWGQARPILPPMPWSAYARMTDEDLKAIYAYLRTVPAIANHVPEAVVAPLPAETAPAAAE